MALTFDPEIAAALAPMAESGFTPPAVGDVACRRAKWEPIIGAASTAQPIPGDVTTSEHYATADDSGRSKCVGTPRTARHRVRRSCSSTAAGTSSATSICSLGVWQVPDGPECVNAVRTAVELGYRHIDTAQAYGNEQSVGRALREW
jgi:hypothetical protein